MPRENREPMGKSVVDRVLSLVYMNDDGDKSSLFCFCKPASNYVSRKQFEGNSPALHLSLGTRPWFLFIQAMKTTTPHRIHEWRSHMSRLMRSIRGIYRSVTRSRTFVSREADMNDDVPVRQYQLRECTWIAPCGEVRVFWSPSSMPVSWWGSRDQWLIAYFNPLN